MSAISTAAARAFLGGDSFSRGSTHVRHRVDPANGEVVSQMFLHGSLIAFFRRLPNRRIHLSFRGWVTPLTRNRLNAILTEARSPWVFAIRGCHPHIRSSRWIHHHYLPPLPERTSWVTHPDLFPLWGSGSAPHPDLALVPFDLSLPGCPLEWPTACQHAQTARPATDAPQSVSRRPPPGVRRANIIPLNLP